MSAGSIPWEKAVLQHTPNGILMVDEDARIRFANPAFHKMFRTGEEDLTGRKAADYLHADCFEQAIAGGGELSVRVSVPEHDIHYRAGLFAVEGQKQYCGIFVDTSDEERARAELSQVRQETLARAQEVIHQQMQTAQQIAGLLGETTAEAKVLLARLMDLFHQEGTA